MTATSHARRRFRPRRCVVAGGEDDRVLRRQRGLPAAHLLHPGRRRRLHRSDAVERRHAYPVAELVVEREDRLRQRRPDFGADSDGTIAAKTVVAIVLTARGYTQGRLERADLSRNAPSGMSIYVYRNGTRIATVQSTAYTDNINQTGSGSYTYNVCAAPLSSCSKQVTVSF
jgi:hypothetical protein